LGPDCKNDGEWALPEEIMKTSAFILSFVVAACLLASPVPAKSLPRIQPAESGVEVKVCVAQVGRVPQEVQKVAEATVRLLFFQIGVTVRFTSEPPQTDSEAIALRVWERAPGSLPAHALGSAWLGGRGGRQANAFYDRLTEFSGNSDPREYGVLLGYAIAHELGHVLLAEPGHSPTGVMKTCWSQRDAISMLQGVVRFSRADAARILK
jgi:hypothetical protein